MRNAFLRSSTSVRLCGDPKENGFIDYGSLVPARANFKMALSVLKLNIGTGRHTLIQQGMQDTLQSSTNMRLR
jgi:hypothetical protein